MNKSIILIIVIVTTLLVSGCITGQNTKENAEAVAQDFAIKHQNSNWEELYELFTPELKTMRSKESFVNYISKKGLSAEGAYLIFDKVVMQGDNEAYAYYTVSSGVLEAKIPPMHLVFTSEGWRVDGFASYFTDEACLDRDDDGLFLLLEEECKDLQRAECYLGKDIEEVIRCFPRLALQYEDWMICDDLENFKDTLISSDREKFDFLLTETFWLCKAFVTKKQEFCLNISTESVRNDCLEFILNSLHSRALIELSDLPEGWELETKRPRDETEISPEAKELGWKSGYYLRYTKSDKILDQTTSIYPEENISKVFNLPNLPNRTYDELPNPNIGDMSKAYSVTVIENDVELRQYYTIEFIKFNVKVWLYIRDGIRTPETDYEFLKELAKKVESKIDV